jgi:glycosyltransferase involved in cell wall biosynthesis
MTGLSRSTIQKALVFFPHNPYPAKSGAHRRCLSMLQALQTLGYDVTLFSSTLFTDAPWTEESIQKLQTDLGITVSLHQGTSADQDYILYAGKRAGGTVNFSMFTPPGLRTSFRHLFQQLSPEIVVVNYSLWGGLSIGKEFQSALRLIDTIDLYSQNLKMNYVLKQHALKTPIQLKKIDPLLIEETFFSKFDIEATADEYWIFSQYDCTIAISPKEEKAMQQHTKDTTVEYVPITLDAEFIDNTYTDQPILAIGPNPFNLQGYCYFTKRVLPLVLEEIPDFNLKVVGSSCEHLSPAVGTQILGFIPDLKPLYTTSRFAICPLIGGTGQQVKIVEAMAHGVPVIALSNLAESSPIEHGINGFIAQDAAEFASYTVQLWQDPDLCRTLGNAARNAIAQNFSEQVLTNKLKSILNTVKTAQEKQLEKLSPSVVIDGVFFQINQTGIARVWISLLEEWVKTGFAQHVVVLNRGGTAPNVPGIRYRSIHPYNFSRTGIDAEILQTICDEEEADLFISTYYTTPTSTPSIFMGYDMIPEALGMDLNTPGWQEKRYGILHACKYITISENTARDLIKFFPHISDESVTVAHCGINPLFFPANPEEIPPFKDKFNITKPYFMLVGERLGVDGYKNAVLLFKALQKLPNQDIEVVCVGGQTELESELVALAEKITVRLLRLTDAELRAAYSAALALVYPSLYEGFGLPIAEAMACGCPVITCRNSSIIEVAGDAVLYVNPSNPQELANALEQVQEPGIRQTLIAAGLVQSRLFSWEKMAAIIADTLSKTAQQLRSKAALVTPGVWSELRKLQHQLQHSAIPTDQSQVHPLEQSQTTFPPESLSAVQDQLQTAQKNLKQARSRLNKLKSKLEATQAQLQKSESMVIAMQTSKFWQIRAAWFRLKKAFKLPAAD